MALEAIPHPRSAASLSSSSPLARCVLPACLLVRPSRNRHPQRAVSWDCRVRARAALLCSRRARRNAYATFLFVLFVRSKKSCSRHAQRNAYGWLLFDFFVRTRVAHSLRHFLCVLSLVFLYVGKPLRAQEQRTAVGLDYLFLFFSFVNSNCQLRGQLMPMGSES